MKVKSKKQAGLFGIVAGGGTPKKGVKSLSVSEAHKSLRGVKVKSLPEYASKKKAKKRK